MRVRKKIKNSKSVYLEKNLIKKDCLQIYLILNPIKDKLKIKAILKSRIVDQYCYLST